jgi:hypothetical protein
MEIIKTKEISKRSDGLQYKSTEIHVSNFSTGRKIFHRLWVCTLAPSYKHFQQTTWHGEVQELVEAGQLKEPSKYQNNEK